ncbi:MAG TPA: YciI family protein [bacterium]|nr:YciI family protein [bacterium]
MTNFLILHSGFEQPTPEQMSAWNTWFESIADKQVDRGGLRGGREISHSGTRELPFGKDSMTGYTIIEAESLDAAEKIARQCPIVASTTIYEIHK